MRNLFYNGENILVRWSIYDKHNEPILFSSLVDVIVKISDSQGTSQVFSKLEGTIVAGVETNQIQFEITEAMTASFSTGKLVGRFTYKIPSADHASNILTDIIDEGISSDFITLQK